MSAMDPTMGGQPPTPDQPDQGPPTLPDGTLPVDPALVSNALLQALLQTARAAASSSHSGAEAKDYGAAARELAQAVVILDPTLSQGGTPLQHDVVIKGMEHASNERVAAISASAQVEMAKTQATATAAKDAKQRAAAPTPARGAVANA